MCECYFLVLPLTNQVFDFFEAFTPAYVLKTNDWLGKTLLMAIILGWFCLFLIYVWNRIFFYHVKVLVYLPTLSLLSQNWQKKYSKFCYLFFSSSRKILIYYYYFDWKCTFIWNKKFDSLPKSFVVYSILSSVRFCKRLFFKIFQVTLRQLAHIQ